MKPFNSSFFFLSLFFLSRYALLSISFFYLSFFVKIRPTLPLLCYWSLFTSFESDLILFHLIWFDSDLICCCMFVWLFVYQRWFSWPDTDRNVSDDKSFPGSWCHFDWFGNLLPNKLFFLEVWRMETVPFHFQEPNRK